MTKGRHDHSVHIVVKEQISATLAREGGLKSMELRGDMNLHITDASLARVRLTLGPAVSEFGSELQFKQHPNVAKFTGSKDRVVALKDPSRSFPVNQSLAVLKWRYSGKDESLVPLSSVLLQFFGECYALTAIRVVNCWPTPSNEGTCDVNIEYELENQALALHDLVISIPLPYVQLEIRKYECLADHFPLQPWLLPIRFFTHRRLGTKLGRTCPRMVCSVGGLRQQLRFARV